MILLNWAYTATDASARLDVAPLIDHLDSSYGDDPVWACFPGPCYKAVISKSDHPAYGAVRVVLGPIKRVYGGALGFFTANQLKFTWTSNSWVRI